jgi:predicted RNA-binding Zn-ribbon protein involved in translation (DUF1610 family)
MTKITIKVLEFSISVERPGRPPRTYKPTRLNIRRVADYITCKQYLGQAQIRPWCGQTLGYVAEISRVYRSGDVACMTCGEIVRHNPAIVGVSHGYCPACGQLELARVDAWIAEFTRDKTAFAVQVSEVAQ